MALLSFLCPFKLIISRDQPKGKERLYIDLVEDNHLTLYEVKAPCDGNIVLRSKVSESEQESCNQPLQEMKYKKGSN